MKQVTFLALILCILACEGKKAKQMLQELPDSSINIFDTYTEMEELLNNPLLNKTFSIFELSNTDFSISDTAAFSFFSPVEKNAYKWAADIYNNDQYYRELDTVYLQPFYSNVILSSKTLLTNNDREFNYIRGYSTFLRGYAHFNLQQFYGQPYNPLSANPNLGIVLKLTQYADEKVRRTPVLETYERILADLFEAVEFLPPTPQPKMNRSCKPAALAMIARVFLCMGNYDKALQYADSSLKQYNTLIDFNTLVPSYMPFKGQNMEVLYKSSFRSKAIEQLRKETKGYTVDEALYNLYEPNDLRRDIYFTKTPKGIYLNADYCNDSTSFFSGIATDEVYLIRAECLSMKGQPDEAMKVLNYLRSKRYKAGTYVPLIPSDAYEARQFILQERRKELCFRGLRWIDLKRLNLYQAANITLHRTVNGQTYTLRPLSPLYVFPLPSSYLNHATPQNPR